jgi:hypothetical protein
MQQHVLLAHGGEDVAVMVAHPLGQARLVGVPAQVGAVIDDQLGDVRDADRAVDLDHFVSRHAQVFADQALERVRRAAIEREPDRPAPAAALERGLELAHQVLGLFLDFQVAVAQHPEDAAAGGPVAGKELIQEQLQQGFQRQEADLARRPRGQPDVARELRRDRDHRPHRFGIGDPLEIQHQRQPAIGDEGEGMRRVQRQGGHHRKDLGQEMLLHRRQVVAGQVTGLDDMDAFRRQQAAQVAPAFLLGLLQRQRVAVDQIELLRRGAAIG